MIARAMVRRMMAIQQQQIMASKRTTATTAELAKIPNEVYGPGELPEDSPYYSTYENPLYMNRSPNDPMVNFKPAIFTVGECFIGACDAYGESLKEHDESSQYWGRLWWYFALPALVGQAIWTYKNEVEHAKHFRRPRFRAIESLRRRNHKFWWGDGNREWFHNPYLNALPDGYLLPDPNRSDNVQISENPPRWA